MYSISSTVTVAFIGLLLPLQGDSRFDQPDWWIENLPVIDSNAVDNSHGPANIGQAKHMAHAALIALHSVNPSLADAIESDLVGAGPTHPIENWLAPTDAAGHLRQYAALNIGQLKAIADPFYRHLNTSSPVWVEIQLNANGTKNAGTFFPWTSTTEDDSNTSIATIGQLKAVFSLRFEDQAKYSGPDNDSDGLSDAWETAYFGSTTGNSSASDSEPDGASNATEYLRGTNPLKRDHPAVGLKITRASAN